MSKREELYKMWYLLVLIDLFCWLGNVRRLWNVYFFKKVSIFILVDEYFFLLNFFFFRVYLDWNGINKLLKVRWYYNFDVFVFGLEGIEINKIILVYCLKL